MNSVLIVDGFSLAFRAFYSYPATLTAPDGKPINAVLGFLTLLFLAIDELKPSHIVVCFDVPQPTFRHKQYPAYKANRSETPELFKEQIDPLKRAVAECGIACYEYPGYEADDVMGVFAKLAEKKGWEALLFTADQDSFQLVSDYVKVVRSKKGNQFDVFDREKVFEKALVYPEQIIDLKALKGDASDNIPGVKGIGEKTAAKLLDQFGDLNGVYAGLESVSSKSVKQKLIDDKDNAYLSHDLATIRTDFDLNIGLEDCHLSIDWPSFFKLCTSYRFVSLMKKYQDRQEPAVESQKEDSSLKKDYEVIIIDSVSALKKLLPELRKGFAFDLETTSLSFHEAEIVGISFSLDPSTAYYLPLNDTVNPPKEPEQQTALLFNIEEAQEQKALTLNPYLKILKPIFEDSKIAKVTHNGKFEQHILRRYDIQLKEIAFDTMIAAFLCFPFGRVGLKELVSVHFDVHMTAFEDLVSKEQNFLDVPIKDAADYAGADALYTWRLKTFFEEILKEKELESLFYTIEMPLQSVLTEMEQTGVSIDIEALNAIRSVLSKEQESLERQIYRLAESPFNINSTKQLGTVLFDNLGLPVIKKTKTGRSTDASVLEELQDKHPIIKPLLDYRSNEKLLSTYVNALPHLIHPQTQRVHTSFNQTIAITGRLSSTGPNLQNIPIRTEKGMLIRSVFVPSSEDRRLLCVDYSQIELRLMAHFSGDEAMIKAFCDDQDIHVLTASKLYHCEPQWVTKEQRYNAKAVNFGIIYGISAFGLAKNTGMSRKESQVMIDNYFEMFPGVKAFIEGTIEQAKKDGFVKTAFGRIRPLPHIHSKDHARRNFEERVAVNTILQGTAADIIKIAMIKIQSEIEKQKLESRLLIQVHDELVFDLCESERDNVIQLVRETMQTVVQYRVPLSVDVEIGKNWKDIREL